jgi:protein-disulfide isomerase
MNKRLVVSVTFVVMIIVVAIRFSSYQANLLEMHDKTKYLEKIAASKQSSLVNLENGSPVLGSENAPITIIEFGDYQCEACYHWFHNTRADIIDNYIETGKAKLVFVDLPFLGSDSIVAAQATYCAEDQGKYWDYHNTLYNFQEEIDNGWASKDRLAAFAFNLDMNLDEFSDCLDTAKYNKRVKANYDEAIKQGAEATPTFIIITSDGTPTKIRGAQPYSAFLKVIDPLTSAIPIEQP